MFLSYTATELPSPSPCSTVVISITTQTSQCVNSEQHAVTQKEHNPVTMTTITQREQCTPSHIPVVTTSTVSTITQKELSVTVTLGTTGMKDVSMGRTANCTRLAGGLGVLTAVMTLMLVGVVLGWVCSWHRKKDSFSIKKR